MSGWPVVALTAIVDCLETGKRPRGGAVSEGVASLGGEHVRENGTVTCDGRTFVPRPFFDAMRKGHLRDGDILIVKDGATTGKTGLVRLPSPDFEAVGNEHVFIIRTNERLCLQRFAYHLLRSPIGNQMIMSDFRGAAQGGISRGFADKVRFPLPPLDEQRRIVGVLDRAAEIRRRADAARAKARAIIPALFLETFGDPATNPKGWATTAIGGLKDVQLRNGISPSKAGKVIGKVLTLSAITRGAFDPFARKESTFAAPLNEEQSVSRSLFLICRGNGNRQLVGQGASPTNDMPGVAFPDTMIALRVNDSEIAPGYLSAVWSSAHLRAQIDAAAKTTNGTFKINQGAIERFSFPLPPLPLQTAFAEQVRRLETLARALDAAAAKAEAMAAALSAEVFG